MAPRKPRISTGKPRELDFTNVDEPDSHRSDGIMQDSFTKPAITMTEDGKLLSPKQIRARIRRKRKRFGVATQEEIAHLYNKPLDDWDMQELAQGRPRNSHGNFKGAKPKWINATIHEDAMTRFQFAVKTAIRGTSVDALTVISDLINNDEYDDKGKPVVPPSVKLEASKFLLEHVIGKPTQRIEGDISVKLQGILAQVMVNPADVVTGPSGGNEQSYSLGHFPGMTMALAEKHDGDDDDEYFE